MGSPFSSWTTISPLAMSSRPLWQPRTRRCASAASAAEARQRLAEHLPAVIIADLGMPVEDGFSFICDVRQSDARWIPAIALSAYADTASRNAVLAAGFTAFLAKPTRPHALVELVVSVLNGAP